MRWVDAAMMRGISLSFRNVLPGVITPSAAAAGER